MPRKGLRVLFVDDEDRLRELMASELPRMGHEVTTCGDGHEAFAVLEQKTFDAAILDLKMPGLSGIDVLKHLKHVSPDTDAIIMTGYATVETSVEAMRLGAEDYLKKPCKLAEIDAVLTRVTARRELQQQNRALESRVKAAEGPSDLIGGSSAMSGVHRYIDTIAPSDSTVLILGETGTGKELVARSIWKKSDRAEKPFVPINCGALSEQLVESELFGHVKGAFTGADQEHTGLFEVANGGTLFLDEVGELTKAIQVKLLRFLESGEIRRVGDTKNIPTDVRVLCATHRDLSTMIEKDEFREDLFFRINTFEIHLPSLKERQADIPDLARHLLARAARRPVDQVNDLLAPETMDVLMAYSWTGNVREMANVMEHAWIISGGGIIRPEHLPHRLEVKSSTASVPASTPSASASVSAAPTPDDGTPRTLKEIELEHTLRVLEKHNGNKSAAAQELGISLKTMYNKLNAMQQKDQKAAG